MQMVLTSTLENRSWVVDIILKMNDLLSGGKYLEPKIGELSLEKGKLMLVAY